MVSIDKVEKGIANYLDAELMPQFTGSALEKVLVGTAMSLAIRKSGSIIASYKDNKVVKMLGVMDDEGNIDIDTLSEEIKKNMPLDGVTVNVPVIGELVFNDADIDKLCSYINA